MFIITKAISKYPPDFTGSYFESFVFFVLSVYNRHFLPYGRADLTASALLRRTCGGQPQLHPPRLTSAATSTHE